MEMISDMYAGVMNSYPGIPTACAYRKQKEVIEEQAGHGEEEGTQSRLEADQRRRSFYIGSGGSRSETNVFFQIYYRDIGTRFKKETTRPTMNRIGTTRMKKLLLLCLVPACMAEILAQRRTRKNDSTCNAALPWTVQRKAYDDLPHSVFSTLMQCPTELHGCSDRIVSCGSGTYKITCSCAPNCIAYRDCCWNVESAEGPSDPEMGMSACVEIEVDDGNTRFIYMVVGCPPMWAQDDVRLACEQSDSLNSTFYRIPATSVNHITYRNGFCALCNNDLVNATFWRAVTYGASQKTIVGMPYIVMKKTALHLRPCPASVLEDTCPQGVPESVQRKCKTYYAPVENDLKTEAYRNVYCAICNGANLSSLSCSPAFNFKLLSTSRKKGPGRHPDAGTVSHLAALFRPVRTTPTCYVEHDGLCYIKYASSVYNPIQTVDDRRATNGTTPSPFTPTTPEKIDSGGYTLHRYVTVVSMSLSVCCLFLKIVIFCARKEARSFSSKCTMCLSVTLMLSQLMFLMSSCFSLAPLLCVFSAVVAHYGFLSTITWTTALSYDIWRNVTTLKHCSGHERTLLVYGALSWGSPLAVVASAVVVDKAAPQSAFAPGYGVIACWLGTSGGLIAYFLVPFGALLITCVVLYIKTTMGSLLWALYKALGATTWSEEFLYFAASAIAINCGVFLLASAFSLPTALVMPRLFYYSMFHLTAAVCYLVGGVGSLRNASIIDGVTATTCGTFHAVNFMYSMRTSPIPPLTQQA
ncbi:hypothetical protein V5799_017424 [Amblyomma americanum]|uniref:G-protein coupled receptors family 2 profile 2 domain-containing protein n=1 Tax=Amblyomma americanum TaxID=6943 RepID=A0AAQ4F3B3_AMBAM